MTTEPRTNGARWSHGSGPFRGKRKEIEGEEEHCEIR